MVAPEASGRGIARQLVEHVLDRARQCGYRAMQFNSVVRTNHHAVEPWHRLGFERGQRPRSVWPPYFSPMRFLTHSRQRASKTANGSLPSSTSNSLRASPRHGSRKLWDFVA